MLPRTGWVGASGVASPEIWGDQKIWGGAKGFILGE